MVLAKVSSKYQEGLARVKVQGSIASKAAQLQKVLEPKALKSISEIMLPTDLRNSKRRWESIPKGQEFERTIIGGKQPWATVSGISALELLVLIHIH